MQDSAWRGELADRVQAYRTRRRRPANNAGQSRFSFEHHEDVPACANSVVVAEPSPSGPDDFSFTIAIGRYASKTEDDARMTIDVSADPGSEQTGQQVLANENISQHTGLYPVANIDERRLAAFIDAACLMFAYGGFLALFGSLGGQFTLSKLSAAVYVSAFAIVYLQYFALFTIFGGTTPGMMLRGLQVVSFSGESPEPRQMLLRAVGYMLSAGTFFLGFMWTWWDEDALTWHDRISRTYLSSTETYANAQTSGAAQGR